MPSRRPSTTAGRWAVCTEFVGRLKGSINAVAIWASEEVDRAAVPQLVRALGGGFAGL